MHPEVDSDDNGSEKSMDKDEETEKRPQELTLEQIAKQQIVYQGSCLCNLYVQTRLQRSGILNRRVIKLLWPSKQPDQTVYDVFPLIKAAGIELERAHPRIYSNIAKQLSPILIGEYGEMDNLDPEPLLLEIMAEGLFMGADGVTNVNWGKIVSFFSITGGLAVDCVRLDQYDNLRGISKCAAEMIDIYIAQWVIDNGGWRSIMQRIHPVQKSITMYGWLLIVFIVLTVIYLIGSHINCVCDLFNYIFGV